MDIIRFICFLLILFIIFHIFNYFNHKDIEGCSIVYLPVLKNKENKIKGYKKDDNFSFLEFNI